MDHLAILNPKIAKIEDIISSKKTIESRWYKHKIKPWNNIKAGECVYFKKSGSSVTAKAKVSKVLQFENPSTIELANLADLYKGQGNINLNMNKLELLDYAIDRPYIILIFLENAEYITPFAINKKGYGCSSAWITLENIIDIKARS